MAEMMRQGDVLLADILLVPRKFTSENKERLKEIGKGEKILAYGEKSGHSHTLRGDVTFYTGSGITLCQVSRDGAQLVHQEHDQINIGEGDYIVINQREYDLLEGIRMVSD